MKAFLILFVVAIVLLILFANKSSLPSIEPPITVKYRNSAVGIGKVLILHNTSTFKLYEIWIDGPDANGNDARDFVANSLDPDQTIEVGWMQLHKVQITGGHAYSIYAKGPSLFPNAVVDIPK